MSKPLAPQAAYRTIRDSKVCDEYKEFARNLVSSLTGECEEHNKKRFMFEGDKYYSHELCIVQVIQSEGNYYYRLALPFSNNDWTFAVWEKAKEIVTTLESKHISNYISFHTGGNRNPADSIYILTKEQ